MTFSCYSVTNTWCPKIVLHDVRLTLGTPQIPTNLSNHLMKILGTLPPHGVGLHVLVEEFVRVQLWVVAGKEEPWNLVALDFQSGL